MHKHYLPAFVLCKDLTITLILKVDNDEALIIQITANVL